MRKFLLVLSCVGMTAYMSSAQSTIGQKTIVKGKVAQPARVIKSQNNVGDSPGYNQVHTSVPYQAKRMNTLTGQSAVSNIGTTEYDLQSNSSVAPRLVNHGNGTMTAVWTFANEHGSGYPSRGTGYNFYDGAGWTGPNANRLEGTVRTGWPNVAVLGNGKEIVISHDPQIYGQQLGTNASVGSTTWSFAVAGSTTSSLCPLGGAIWPRMAISGANGQYVHVISNSSDSTCKKLGVKQAFVYARSSDYGLTFPIHDMILPGFDSTVTLVSAADDYAIDARDSTVAIVHGGLGESTIVWRSDDNGSSFMKMYVDSFEFMPDIDLMGAAGDTGFSSDGSNAIFVDKNHVIHVAESFNFDFRQDDGTGTVGTFFSPGQTTLIYWDDLTKTKQELPMLLSHVDIDADGQYSTGQFTTSATIDAANGITAAARYGNNSLLCKPSFASDDVSKMFIVFSLPQDNDSTDDGQSFRDVWVRASLDNGASWPDSLVENLTCSFGVEESFPVAARLANDTLNIMFQSDDEPGTALTNADPDRQNDINVIRVPVSKIIDKTAGCAFNSMNPVAKNDLFSVSNSYPNPFSNESYFDVNLKKTGTLLVSITNILGQSVQHTTYPNMASGYHTLSIDASKLQSGVYFYTVSSGDNSITRKMVVQK